MTDERPYERSHPWISFRAGLGRATPQLWSLLGQVAARCEQVARAVLPPAAAAEMHKLYLIKGARAAGQEHAEPFRACARRRGARPLPQDRPRSGGAAGGAGGVVHRLVAGQAAVAARVGHRLDRRRGSRPSGGPVLPWPLRPLALPAAVHHLRGPPALAQPRPGNADPAGGVTAPLGRIIAPAPVFRLRVGPLGCAQAHARGHPPRAPPPERSGSSSSRSAPASRSRSGGSGSPWTPPIPQPPPSHASTPDDEGSLPSRTSFSRRAVAPPRPRTAPEPFSYPNPRPRGCPRTPPRAFVPSSHDPTAQSPPGCRLQVATLAPCEK